MYDMAIDPSISITLYISYYIYRDGADRGSSTRQTPRAPKAYGVIRVWKKGVSDSTVCFSTMPTSPNPYDTNHRSKCPLIKSLGYNG